jgi:hypothetical protein
VISLLQRTLSTQDNTAYKHKRQTSMPSAGFKPTIPATKRPQTYALDHMATKFDLRFRHRNNLDIKTQLRVEISQCYFPVITIHIQLWIYAEQFRYSAVPRNP